MKYSANMLWSKPFVEEARHLFKANRVTQIKGWKSRQGIFGASDGWTKCRFGWYSISIRTTETYEHKAVLKEDALLFLAHELAHTVFWEHDVRHLKLLIKIMQNFAKTATKLKVKDTQESIDATSHSG